MKNNISQRQSGLEFSSSYYYYHRALLLNGFTDWSKQHQNGVGRKNVPKQCWCLNLQYTIDNTPKKYIKDIIVVDDASTIPMADVLDKELPPSYRKMVKVYRFNTKEGKYITELFAPRRAHLPFNQLNYFVSSRLNSCKDLWCWPKPSNQYSRKLLVLWFLSCEVSYPLLVFWLISSFWTVTAVRRSGGSNHY